MYRTKKDKAVQKGSRRKWLLIVPVFAALILGFCIAFNVAGMGVRANNVLASLPITGGLFQNIEEPKDPLQLEKEELQNSKKLLAEQRTNLDELANSLMSWEQQLKEKEEELMKQRTVIEDLQQRLDARVKNIQELVTYYEKMDASAAVSILDNVSDSQLILNILRNMKEQKCSDILAAMDPRKAARLIEAMSAE